MSVRLILPLLLTGLAFSQGTRPLEQQAREIIEAAMKDHNPDTRKLAATALGLGGPRQPFSPSSKKCSTTRMWRCGSPPSPASPTGRPGTPCALEESPER